MGIRFFCPKGHKLNVKLFQAGKKAVCPFCGERVLVPRESTRISSKLLRKQQKQAAAQEGAAPTPGDSATASPPTDSLSAASQAGHKATAASQDVLLPATSDSSIQAAVTSTGPEVFSSQPGLDLAGIGTPHAKQKADAGSEDPLAGPNNVVWYVRPTVGGQFGPATPDVMRGWLADGRIRADALVWREGWAEWKGAGKVFPQLASAHVATGLEELLAEEEVIPPTTSSPNAKRTAKSLVEAIALPARPVLKKKMSRTIVAIGAVVAALLLLVVLVAFGLMPW